MNNKENQKENLCLVCGRKVMKIQDSPYFNGRYYHPSCYARMRQNRWRFPFGRGMLIKEKQLYARGRLHERNRIIRIIRKNPGPFSLRYKDGENLIKEKRK